MYQYLKELVDLHKRIDELSAAVNGEHSEGAARRANTTMDGTEGDHRTEGSTSVPTPETHGGGGSGFAPPGSPASTDGDEGPIDPNRLYTMAEVARILRMVLDTAYRIPESQLTRTRVGPRGGLTLVMGSDLLRYLQLRRTKRGD